MERKGRVFRCALFFSAFVSFLLASSPSPSQEQIRLKDVRIEGNLRVEEDGIRLYIKARGGQIFDAGIIEQDVKSIYRMGFFDDVKAELSPEGVLTYLVKEKPYIREVRIAGYSQLSRERIETALGIAPRTILDRDRVASGVEKVRKLYAEQGYVNAEVGFDISLIENNQAVVQVEIFEGNRLLISRIRFEGNRTFSDSELKDLMGTKEKWFLSSITNRGVLDQDVLTNDLAILASHYYDHGYIDHKISDPVVVRNRDGIEVVIRVAEGDQYRVGKVEIGGELIEDAAVLLHKVQLTTGQIFRGSRLRNDISTLSELYADRGFAFAQVEPMTRVQREEKLVDVALIINQGPPVYFNRILIGGNTKTRDKVIRRELVMAEQELFSGKKITQSRNALQRTGYFEDVQFTTKRTDQPDAVDLTVEVKEGPTGSFTIGAGYSSGDQFVFTTSVAERNLFGRGQGVNASFDLGTVRQDFILSFNEPYLYDTYVSLGLDAFNSRRQFNDFTSRRTGFGTRTGYPLKRVEFPFFSDSRKEAAPGFGSDQPGITEYLRGGMGYELTREKISGIATGAPSSIRDEKGVSWTSSLTPSLSYDSRDHFFTPTEGTTSNLSFKFAGLGGDNRFIKIDTRARWYYPLLKDPGWGGTYSLALGGILGYGVGLKERSGGKQDLPLFERYFVGGMNSVRGFRERSLGPREGNDVVGGDKQAVLSAELLFPIIERFGLRGVAFFDMGQAFGKSQGFDLGEFRRSIGVGGRWLSPFGPIRLELGFPLNKKSGDDTSVVGFSVGGQP